MDKVQKLVVTLLVVTIVLSAISVILNLVVFNIGSQREVSGYASQGSNRGGVELFIEGNNPSSSGGSGG